MRFIAYFLGLPQRPQTIEVVDADDLGKATMILGQKIQDTTPLQVIADVEHGLIVQEGSDEYVVVRNLPTQEE